MKARLISDALVSYRGLSLRDVVEILCPSDTELLGLIDRDQAFHEECAHLAIALEPDSGAEPKREVAAEEKTGREKSNEHELQTLEKESGLRRLSSVLGTIPGISRTSTAPFLSLIVGTLHATAALSMRYFLTRQQLFSRHSL
jgi:hypothetical protein